MNVSACVRGARRPMWRLDRRGSSLSWVQIQRTPTTCYVCYRTGLWDSRSIGQL